MAAAVSWAPDIVVVVAADGVGKAVRPAEEIYSPSFSVVACQDATFGLLFLWKRAVNTGNSCHHILPTEPVGKLLREFPHFAGFHFYPSVASSAARDLRQRLYGSRRHRHQGSDYHASYDESSRVGGPNPAPSATLDKPLYSQGSRGEEHRVGRSEEVELGVLDHEEHEEHEVDPT